MLGECLNSERERVPKSGVLSLLSLEIKNGARTKTPRPSIYRVCLRSLWTVKGKRCGPSSQ
ncbi:hypothetical protein Hanom_Chr09g00864841 [Helianthus anomalus]